MIGAARLASTPRSAYARRADLEPCYNWAPVKQTWPTATPDEIKSCAAGVDICDFDYPFQVKPGALCAWGNAGDVVSDLTGHGSAAQKTWDLDFVDQRMVGGFTLHLVGRIAP